MMAVRSPRWVGCLNPATVSGLDLPEVIALAARAGLGFVEVSIQQVLELGPARVRGLLNQYGVQVAAASGILPAGPMLPAPLMTNDTTAFHDIEHRVAAMAAIGCPVATVLLNPATDMTYGLAQTLAVRRLQMLAHAAAEHGIHLAVEAVGAPCGHGPDLSGPYSFITTLPQLAKLLDAVAAPNAGVCVDSYHWAATGADPTHITYLGHPIAHVQIADTPHRVPVTRLADRMRLFPGDGALHWAVFATALARTDYTGTVSVELFNLRLRELPVEEIAAKAAAAVHHVATAVTG